MSHALAVWNEISTSQGVLWEKKLSSTDLDRNIYKENSLYIFNNHQQILHIGYWSLPIKLMNIIDFHGISTYHG